MRTVLEVEIWSDVVCPWCAIGKRRFERAVAEVAGELEVQVVYRPYQLDPRAPLGPGTPVADTYARKFGGPERARQIIDHVTGIAAAEGLEFHMDRALRANTGDAHRLLLHAQRLGLQAELNERLLRAYFSDGLDIGDHDVLARCAADVGLDGATAHGVLDGDEMRDELDAALAQATADEVTAVPTFVLHAPDGRWVVPGAQDTEVFVRVLRRLAERFEQAAEVLDG